MRKQLAFPKPKKRKGRTFKKALFPKPCKNERKAHLVDLEATKAMNFANRKSIVLKSGHIHVVGLEDHRMMRVRIFEQAGGRIRFYGDDSYVSESAMCQLCPTPHYVTWSEGHWIHPKSKGEKRCDGPCCGKFACTASHEKQHGRKFTLDNFYHML